MSRVFLLGSGFSVKAGAPLSRSVLKLLFSTDRMTPQVADLATFLQDFLFPDQEDWINRCHLEEVLSRLDLIRHYRPYHGIDYNRVSYFEEQLLGEFTQLLSPSSVEPVHPAYRDFSRFLKPGDTLISFNYDLVAEMVVTMSGLEYDYSLHEDSVMPEGTDLLKLHGSINLYYCPLCGEVYFFSHKVTAHPVPGGASVGTNRSPHTLPQAGRLLICRQCSEQGKPVYLNHFIIAPTLFKSYSLPALRRLWFKALRKLAGAREIYFIGYSLPEADILSYQLLDFSRGLCAHKQEVLLINGPKPSLKRFSQLYGPDLTNTGLYFEQWAKTL